MAYSVFSVLAASFSLPLDVDEVAAATTAAVTPEQLESVRSSLDYIWIMIAAAMVFLMQAGFMCLESGMARAKNSINVAVKNMTDFVLSFSAFWLFGFGLMFGTSYGGLFGTSEFMLDFNGDHWLPVFFVFQAVFCGTAATIDSGAVAERTRFSVYLAVSMVASGLIYPIFGHWAWGSFYNGETPGWLESMGFIDFAGSTVVHSIGGWIALAGVIMIGPRKGKFRADGTPRKIAPHSLPLVYLGTFILVFGWFGFNCGSTLAADTSIAEIAMTTMLSACFGAISAAALSWMGPTRRPEPEMIANGLLGGLVAITAGCAAVAPAGAAIIGLLAGMLVYSATWFVEHVLKLDDVVGAIPVHGVCGVWGTLAVAIFARADHLPAGVTRIDQFGVQLLGVGAGFLWSFGISMLLLTFVRMFSPLRVSEEDEDIGLNVAEHGATSSVLELAGAMQRATRDGDYTENVKVQPEFGTEVGDLGSCFNQMVDAIQHEKRQLQGSLAQQDAQRAEIEQQMAKLQEAEQRIRDDKERLRAEADRASVEAAELATEGSRAMEQSGRSLEQIEEVTKSIQDIAHMVSGFSEQTNLLSLNASIEAARAGDAGKGFAVVANEVRSLAAESKKAANHISDLMSTTSSRVQEGRHHNEATSDVLTRIIETTHRNADTIGRIADGSDPD